MAGVDWFVDDGFFWSICRGWFVNVGGFLALGEVVFRYMIKPLYQLEHKVIA